MISKVCHIILSVEEADQESVRLELGEAKITASIEMTDLLL